MESLTRDINYASSFLAADIFLEEIRCGAEREVELSGLACCFQEVTGLTLISLMAF